MPDRDELINIDKGELLDIFTEEKDQKGTDLLAMSDFFQVFVGKIEIDMDAGTAWEIIHNIGAYTVERRILSGAGDTVFEDIAA